MMTLWDFLDKQRGDFVAISFWLLLLATWLVAKWNGGRGHD